MFLWVVTSQKSVWKYKTNTHIAINIDTKDNSEYPLIFMWARLKDKKIKKEVKASRKNLNI